MNKKFLSAILFGALMVTSTGTFVSCKDYDDDIDRIDQELTDIKSAIAALQSKVDGGKYVTNVAKNGDGITVTWSDNSTSTIETIKGDKGDKTIVTIVDGYWAFDGVKSEYPAQGEAAAAGHDAKISDNGYWMVWDATKSAYVETEYIAGGVVAAEVKGGWELTVRDKNGETQTITIPTGSAMGYMDVWNGDNLYALYGINADDVKYSPYEKTLKKGVYSTLDRDLKVVVNPKATDASLYDYKLENTEGKNTELVFKEAIPFKGLLQARAASDNGVWVLPHDYRFDQNEILNDIRTNLYLRFKSNDDKAHALSLTATLNETTIKTPYDLSATLRKIDSDAIKTSLKIKNIDKCYINTLYTPVYTDATKDSTAVYDYWLTLDQTPQNLKNAAMFGVEIPASEEGHSFKYTKEAGVYNPITFVYNYILMDGTVVEGVSNGAPTFDAYLTDELAKPGEANQSDFIAPFDAKLIIPTGSNAYPELTYIPNNAGVIGVAAGAQHFGLNKEYDLTDLVNAMDDYSKLVWNNALTSQSILGTGPSGFASIEATLIGGEGDNNANWINERLLKNIRFAFSGTDNKKLTVQFLVSDKWSDIGTSVGGYIYTVDNTNFKLDNAYNLTLTVKDEQANNAVAIITMPFELKQPTLDITRNNGEFSIWDGAVLKSYGAFVGSKEMHLPLYDAFKPAYATQFSAFIPNAQYYKLGFTQATSPNPQITFMGSTVNVTKSLNNLAYSTVFSIWDTYVTVPAAVLPATEPVVVSTLLDVDYKFYGVYDAKQSDITLKFSSLLNDSELKMVGETDTELKEFVVANGTNEIIITNDDLNFKTPFGTSFYLFDGIDATTGAVVKRATLNLPSFNENQRPFTTFDQTTGTGTDYLFATNSASQVVNFKFEEALNPGVVPAGITASLASSTPIITPAVNASAGKYDINVPPVVANTIQIAKIEAAQGEPVSTAYPLGVAAQKGGMLIQLPDEISDTTPLKCTVTLTDNWGYKNEFSFILKRTNR